MKEDAAVLNWLGTGSSMNPVIRARLDAFMRVNEESQTTIILGALDQLTAEGMIAADVAVQLKTKHTGTFCGDVVYADIFA